MSYRFPYLRRGDHYIPVADVDITARGKSLTIKALVDSGATFSIFREEIADFLDIRVEAGRRIYLEGIGGRILGYLHRLPVQIAGKRFVGKVVFSREFRVSMNIMGRDNLFEPFRITFDEKTRGVEITSRG